MSTSSGKQILAMSLNENQPNIKNDTSSDTLIKNNNASNVHVLSCITIRPSSTQISNINALKDTTNNDSDRNTSNSCHQVSNTDSQDYVTNVSNDGYVNEFTVYDDIAQSSEPNSIHIVSNIDFINPEYEETTSVAEDYDLSKIKTSHNTIPHSLHIYGHQGTDFTEPASYNNTTVITKYTSDGNSRKEILDMEGEHNYALKDCSIDDSTYTTPHLKVDQSNTIDYLVATDYSFNFTNICTSKDCSIDDSTCTTPDLKGDQSNTIDYLQVATDCRFDSTYICTLKDCTIDHSTCTTPDLKVGQSNTIDSLQVATDCRFYSTDICTSKDCSIDHSTCTTPDLKVDQCNKIDYPGAATNYGFDSTNTIGPSEANQALSETNDITNKISLTGLETVLHIDDNDLNNSSSSEIFADSGSEYLPSSISSHGSEIDYDILNDSDKSDACDKIDSNEDLSSGVNAGKDKDLSSSVNGKNERRGAFNEIGEVKSSIKNLQGKLKRDKKETCLYCEKTITNFSRHLLRKHEDQIEVAKIMSLKKGSKERKQLLDDIRKRGNFIQAFGKDGFINPTRRPKAVLQKKPSDYLPCSQCRGFFTRNYLHRHIKQCPKKNEDVKSRHAQAHGLTLIHLSDTNEFKDIKLNVFPHMTCDEITKIVMNDYLIKCYGQRYYMCHKEKHLINTVSQRMRELARFLKVLQDLKNLGELQNYLKPCHFDLLVEGTKEISGYNTQKDSFQSPSLALRWATVLKHVCDIAVFLATKKGDEVVQKNVTTLKHMIETQFRFYISTNANKDLCAKNWKKGSMLPLTDDVIKMNEFVISEERKWSEKLKSDPTNFVYVRNLTEALLAHVILLNRKRSGEAQRITIEDYLRKEEQSGVEDIFDSLTPTEKVLVKNVKRFVIRGKKGRAVPVIFSREMQQHTNILLESRKFVAADNPYLFANSSTPNGFLWSYKILKKVATACNVKNIDTITATGLRKHVATIAQLISMEDNDLEQLSIHLGHEKATHLNFYRKTDDRLQIAKVSKLLLLMEHESISNYRGQSLDDIDLDIPDIDTISDKDCQNQKKIISNKENLQPTKKTTRPKKEIEFLTKEKHLNHKIPELMINIKRTEINDQENKKVAECIEKKKTYSEDPNKKSGTSVQVKKRVLIPWTEEQKSHTKMFFKKHIASKRPPKKHECEDLKTMHPRIFGNKKWAQIKIFIVNLYNKK